MVTVKSAVERIGKDEKTFVALELTGDIDLVQSQTSGRFYATVRRAFMSCTFDLKTAEAFIGKSLPGSIVRTITDPYEYTIRETGEVIELSHSWVYQPEESSDALIISEKHSSSPRSGQNLYEEILEQLG